jgi:hypothetical protein
MYVFPVIIVVRISKLFSNPTFKVRNVAGQIH